MRWVTGLRYEKDIILITPRFVWATQNSSAESSLIRVNTIEGKASSTSHSKQVIFNVKKTSDFLIYTLALLIFLTLTGGVTLANIESLRRMSRNPFVINEYVNDDYSICTHIGTFARPGQRVFIYSPFEYLLCSPVASERWYFGDKQPEVLRITGEFISPADLSPGDMVVMGVSNIGLTGEEIAQVVDLATVTDSLDSLRFSENLAGRITTASMCFHCEK